MTNRPNIDTIASSENLLYEISMLAFALDGIVEASNPRYINLYIENFLLHVRNLHYFFEGTNWDTDLFATDYICAASSKSLFVEIADKDLKDRINKHLSHLTIKRDDKIKKDECYKMARNAIDNIKMFIKNVPRTKICSNFISECEEWLKSMNNSLTKSVKTSLKFHSLSSTDTTSYVPYGNTVDWYQIKGNK